MININFATIYTMKRALIRQKAFYMSIILVLGVMLTGCVDQKPVANVYLGQGIMVGEVTDQSAILQTRLTASDTLVGGELPGTDGWVRFEWSEEATVSVDRRESEWQFVDKQRDHIAKAKIEDLSSGRLIYYRVLYGRDTSSIEHSSIGHFLVNPGPTTSADISFAVVTGMNYYFHYFGNYDSSAQYVGADRAMGYPALQAIADLAPDYFIGTGDNVYFDHPAAKNMERAVSNGKNPLPGYFGGKEVIDEAGMRRKYHVQFAQPRFISMFQQLGTYWEKDDHDYRVNDGDPYSDFPISHELGLKNFREQLPVVDPMDPNDLTYRTIRMTKDLQLWFLEGRDFRSANDDPDGPEKTIWGAKQANWLRTTLMESDATFKCIVSPTPMVGPDDAYKKDNHVNPDGFKYEGETFFKWLRDSGFSDQKVFIICGDRHWQYHASHPSGFEEFSTGALVDANSRAGRVAGDPKSTDPEAMIKQWYVQGTAEEATGGFLLVDSYVDDQKPKLKFSFYDDNGVKLHEVVK